MYAETRGLIDFSSCDGSRRWWAGARMRLRQAKRELDLQRAWSQAHRFFGEMGLSGIDAEQARQVARNAQKRVESLLRPWSKVVQGRVEDDLDLIARWYIINAPDVLRRMGVDLGPR